MAASPSNPVLSVIVTITHGASNLGRCLESLTAVEAPVEIIVPVVDALDNLTDVRRRFPTVRFISVAERVTTAESKHPGRMHLVYDRRRSTGLRAARGQLIAITEDHVIPPRNWCQKIIELHAGLDYAVIGGSIVCASYRNLNRALFLCDFGRYHPPVGARPMRSISDINVSYKRSVLEAIRPLWQDLYHETHVHAAILETGGTLWLTDELTVRHDRGSIAWARILRERFSWARLYAARRFGRTQRLKRMSMAAGCLLLPFLLTWRHGANAIRRGTPVLAYLRLAPQVFLLTVFSSAGELMATQPAKNTPVSSPLETTAECLPDWPIRLASTRTGGPCYGPSPV